MSEGIVRKWVRAFKDGGTNAHDEERSGRPSVITEDLVQQVDGKVRENILFTISSLSNEFPQVSRSVLYGIGTEHLNYPMECDRYGVSDRTATSFASAVLQDIGIVHEGQASHVVDRNETH
ncbi:hypothetical protein AVEN_153554-1 [Araneus ventricosus]|uniref:Mos1 transposase HTH domain-containing protein n=1 Tax=Araneus ventricosus TaxID=182803 RepID=A0A4Y2G5B9_ARAVE|nr:hypothetical protein AVEN_153554-1 [Araneus ventricosus]